MRSWLACILVFLVSAPLLAQTAEKSQTTTTTTTTTTTKPTTTTKKKAPAKKAPTAASEMKTLRDAVNAQQQQIQMLRDELQRRDAAMQQMQSQVNSLQSTASQAQSTAQSAASSSRQNEDSLAALKTTVGTVQTSATATANSLQATDKKVTALESPLAIKYKGITITPGGFVAAQINWRSKNQNLDNFGNFGAIPFRGSSNSYLSEFRETARYTRLSLLAEGKTKSFNVQGYYEFDFEGAAQTANENQTNSWQPRIRELWANVDTNSGISFTGGQTWSLITGNNVGVGPRGLMLPAHISASLIVGLHYTRQNGFRIYKKWELANKKKLYLAFAAEEAQTTSAGAVPAGFTVFGLQNAPTVSLGGGTNCSNAPVAGPTINGVVTTGLAPCSTFASGLSVNMAPDLIAKVALEPGWGHFELGVLGRIFRDRVAPTAASGTDNAGKNFVVESAGVSFNAVLPVVAKKIDVKVSTLWGRGIGRYSTTGIPDVTIKKDGTLSPLRSYQGSIGIETHPSPKLDINFYMGDEYVQRWTQYTGVTGVVPTGSGYGLIGANLSGCQVEIPAAGQACAASNRNVYELSPGFWYRFYKGPAGTIQYGMYYSYFRRYLWTGNLSTSTAAPVYGAHYADQHEILTSFRWYFP